MKLDNSWTKKQTKKYHLKLARDLGITYEDLRTTEWEVIYNGNKDESQEFYTVKFKLLPLNIRSKLKSLNEKDEVVVSLFYDYDYDFVAYQKIETLIANNPPYNNFYSSVFYLRQLNATYIEDVGLMKTLRKQLYVNAITVMETFLSDFMIYLIESNANFFRNFVETFPMFNTKKIRLSSIFVEYENIRKTSILELQNIVFHNLGRIKAYV